MRKGRARMTTSRARRERPVSSTSDPQLDGAMRPVAELGIELRSIADAMALSN
jgi:hypothetical protein